MPPRRGAGGVLSAHLARPPAPRFGARGLADKSLFSSAYKCQMTGRERSSEELAGQGDGAYYVLILDYMYMNRCTQA